MGLGLLVLVAGACGTEGGEGPPLITGDVPGWNTGGEDVEAGVDAGDGGPQADFDALPDGGSADARLPDDGLDCGVGADLCGGQDDASVPEYEPPDGFEIVMLDVGQGDSILVRFPFGSTMLVDGGYGSNAWDVILPYLDNLHLDRLDFVVSSHPDADHCGGLAGVVEELDVGVVWENGQTAETYSWGDFSDAVDEKGIPRKTVHRGDKATIDGCGVEVLNADQGWGWSNADSVVLSIDCEGVTLLLTGDIDYWAQDDIGRAYGDGLKSDVVKVAHHGSADHDPDFTKAVAADIALCSVGKWNNYGHPDPDVVAEWEAVGAAFYRTDTMGTISVLAKDGDMVVQTQW